MRRLLTGLAAAAALTMAGSAQAGFILTTDIVNPIPGLNQFQGNLFTAGVDSYSQGLNQVLDISGSGTIEFFFEGKEAGFTNSFNSTIASINFTQMLNDLSWNNMTVSIGMGNFNPGDIMGDWLFDSGAGQGVQDVGIATNAFGIFFDSADFVGLDSEPVDIGNVVYLGFDDQGTLDADEDHDDLVIKAVLVPEPLTLGLMGIGLFGIGLFARRKNA